MCHGGNFHPFVSSILTGGTNYTSNIQTIFFQGSKWYLSWNVRTNLPVILSEEENTLFKIEDCWFSFTFCNSARKNLSIFSKLCVNTFTVKMVKFLSCCFSFRLDNLNSLFFFLLNAEWILITEVWELFEDQKS
jgi:hypothetical protein